MFKTGLAAVISFFWKETVHSASIAGILSLGKILAEKLGNSKEIMVVFL